jgi:hypothetical protein
MLTRVAQGPPSARRIPATVGLTYGHEIPRLPLVIPQWPNGLEIVI